MPAVLVPPRHRAVHPRVCGEHFGQHEFGGGSRGSSPRVRGTSGQNGGDSKLDRFIPACAGNMPHLSSHSDADTVHPRVCGEHSNATKEGWRSDGSSPRVRGTWADYISYAIAPRFIPACAGNMMYYCWPIIQGPVHPRVCGEHYPEYSGWLPLHGSSPRVRGTYFRHLIPKSEYRFIPACAGNIPHLSSHSDAVTVHPRVCGEHEPVHVAPSLTPGSSPRVRGTCCRRYGSYSKGRFIPACAGNILAAVMAPRYSAVHPRVCGEHEPVHVAPDLTPGSSPRVRGTLCPRVIVCRDYRFIPACAGNIPRCHPWAGRAPVHPRVCGEHEPVHVAPGLIPGSSPRVRGTS